MSSPPPPYSPPPYPPPPPPPPVGSCPVLKAGFPVVLQQLRDRWDAAHLKFVQKHAELLLPVYQDWAVNIPADESTDCGRRATEAYNAAETWIASADLELRGGDPTPQGRFDLTAKLIDDMNCSWPQYQWQNHAANCQYALDHLDATLDAKDVQLDTLIGNWVALNVDCPVPRPAP